MINVIILNYLGTKFRFSKQFLSPAHLGAAIFATKNYFGNNPDQFLNILF